MTETTIGQLQVGQIVRPKHMNTFFMDRIVLAVDHEHRRVKFARPHATFLRKEYDTGFNNTAYSRCEEWVYEYSEWNRTNEEFLVLGTVH